ERGAEGPRRPRPGRVRRLPHPPRLRAPRMKQETPGATQAELMKPARPLPGGLIARLAEAVSEGYCIREPEQLRTYESDGLASFRVPPGVVVLPASTEEVVGCVKLAHEAGVPIVARGSGTGLSGGALPVPGCVLIGLSRMRKILEVDFDNAF